MPSCLQSHGLQSTRLLCPWNFPGKDTGVVCHFLLQGQNRLIFKGIKKKNASPCPFPHKLENFSYSRPRFRNSLLLSVRSIALDLNLCKITWPDPCILTTFPSLHPLSLEEISSCLLGHVLHPIFYPSQMCLSSPSQRQATVPPQGTSRLA